MLIKRQKEIKQNPLSVNGLNTPNERQKSS